MQNVQAGENAPRTPENREALIALSRMMDHWSKELYRRRNHDESKVPPWKFLPLPERAEKSYTSLEKSDFPPDQGL